jgi:hypothetical protein
MPQPTAQYGQIVGTARAFWMRRVWAQETLISCLVGVVLVPFVMPWGYVVKQHVQAPADSWRTPVEHLARVIDDEYTLLLATLSGGRVDLPRAQVAEVDAAAAFLGDGGGQGDLNPGLLQA